ncbi:hypothetical protein GCM10018952_38700 [Streptosporangium vulgare]
MWNLRRAQFGRSEYSFGSLKYFTAIHTAVIGPVHPAGAAGPPAHPSRGRDDDVR